MGTVYLAARAEAGFTQRAALKVARGGFADDLIRKRFREERRILELPEIARLIDGGATDGGVPYVVMEFVDGVPIDTYCSDRGLGLASVSSSSGGSARSCVTRTSGPLSIASGASCCRSSEIGT